MWDYLDAGFKVEVEENPLVDKNSEEFKQMQRLKKQEKENQTIVKERVEYRRSLLYDLVKNFPSDWYKISEEIFVKVVNRVLKESAVN